MGRLQGAEFNAGSALSINAYSIKNVIKMEKRLKKRLESLKMESLRIIRKSNGDAVLIIDFAENPRKSRL